MPIDQVIWSAHYDPASNALTWNNTIDNLAAEIVP